MSTHELGGSVHRGRAGLTFSSHWAWLAIGFVLAFVPPFLLTEAHN
jgi:hypothetical protein